MISVFNVWGEVIDQGGGLEGGQGEVIGLICRLRKGAVSQGEVDVYPQTTDTHTHITRAHTHMHTHMRARRYVRTHSQKNSRK